MKLEVFDPALCCSSGVCGPAPDPRLAAFAGALRRLGPHVETRRYNLAQEPLAFSSHPVVSRLLQDHGPDILPVILVDGREVARGQYPTPAELNAATSPRPEAHA